jgi:hypothetical protein
LKSVSDIPGLERIYPTIDKHKQVRGLLASTPFTFPEYNIFHKKAKQLLGSKNVIGKNIFEKREQSFVERITAF